MMFMRDATQSVEWRGTTYRSLLEVNVAKELHRLGVRSRYEKIPVKELSYLPDFKIDHLPDDGMGPVAWIEVKPAQAIYAVRDHFYMPERFDEPQAFKAKRDDFNDIAPELVKPKGLAELTHKPVLVASAINRNSTVALVMWDDHVEVTRTHPLVCWKNVLKDREHAKRRRQWEQEEAERQRQRERQQAEWQRQQADRDAEQERIGRSNLEAFKRADYSPAKYPGRCIACGQHVEADRLYKAMFVQGWKVCCRHHLDRR